MRKVMAVMLATSAFLASGPLWAFDLWEPSDNTKSYFQSTQLVPGHAEQLHDLEAIGGVPDNDWFSILTREARSYEAIIHSFANNIEYVTLTRHVEGVLGSLQSADYLLSSQVSNFAYSRASALGMRWKVDSTPVPNRLEYLMVGTKVGAPALNAGTRYIIRFRETTQFCPRFNNTGTQSSVLVIQGALEGVSSCDYTAHFFNESGATLATYSGFLGSDMTSVTPMKVLALPGVAGLSGQKGSAQIAHTCGYGSIKAKLVALEPTTGYSFDTLCTSREQ